MTDKMREFVDEVKQLCKDFSDQRDRPYMGDVHAALDGLYEQWQAAQTEQSVPVVGYEQRITDLEDVLRSLACSLSAGGYNADAVDPTVFEKKIRDGIDMLVAPLQDRISQLEAELERLRRMES